MYKHMCQTHFKRQTGDNHWYIYTNKAYADIRFYNISLGGNSQICYNPPPPQKKEDKEEAEKLVLW